MRVKGETQFLGLGFQDVYQCQDQKDDWWTIERWREGGVKGNSWAESGIIIIFMQDNLFTSFQA